MSIQCVLREYDTHLGIMVSVHIKYHLFREMYIANDVMQCRVYAPRRNQ